MSNRLMQVKNLTPNSPADKLIGLEIGRGLAATLVVLYHVARVLEPYAQTALTPLDIFQFGHAGVDFFFVLSGFIIFYIHKKHIGMPSYLMVYSWRRVTRIYPIYWVALTGAVMIAFLRGDSIPDMETLLFSTFLLPGDYSLPLGVAWTLVAEMQFYVFFALLILNRWIGLLAIMIWQVAVLADYFGGPDLAYLPVSSYHLQFLMGIAAAYITQHTVLSPRLILHISLAVFVLASWAENIGLMDGYGHMARLVYGVPSMGILVGVCSVDFSRFNSYALRVLGQLGTSTYSIYLFHLMFIGIFLYILKTAFPGILQHSWLVFFPAVGVGIGGGIVVSKFVELPVLKYTKSLVSGPNRNKL